MLFTICRGFEDCLRSLVFRYSRVLLMGSKDIAPGGWMRQGRSYSSHCPDCPTNIQFQARDPQSIEILFQGWASSLGNDSSFMVTNGSEKNYFKVVGTHWALFLSRYFTGTNGTVLNGTEQIIQYEHAQPQSLQFQKYMQLWYSSFYIQLN